MTFRRICFPIANGIYECVVASLPRDEFLPERTKRLYFSCWGIETSFRKLKYTVKLSNFHAYKPEYVKQEIWARMITYNHTKTLVNQTTGKAFYPDMLYRHNFPEGTIVTGMQLWNDETYSSITSMCDTKTAAVYQSGIRFSVHIKCYFLKSYPTKALQIFDYIKQLTSITQELGSYTKSVMRRKKVIETQNVQIALMCSIPLL